MTNRQGLRYTIVIPKSLYIYMREYMKAANDLRVSGPLYVKPTSDEMLQRIRALSLDERLRFGLIDEEPKTIEVRKRNKRA